MQQPSMRIGEVARRAGVRVWLIRYYEEIGLLPAPTRVAGQRRYDGTVLRRLAVIGVAQRAGLTLGEIRELVEHGSDPVSERLREVAERRLPEIDALIDRARRVRSWLESATTCGCHSIDDCPLFDDDAVRAFAGDDCEVAYVPPQARAGLSRFEERSAHGEVLLMPNQTSG